MQEANKYFTLLQVTVPPETPVTAASEIKILEILGIVSNPELVNSMQLAMAVIPPSTPATLFGLIALLGNLIKMHPKATKAHQEALAATLKNLSGATDAALTFGTFLPICDALMKAPPHKITKGA